LGVPCPPEPVKTEFELDDTFHSWSDEEYTIEIGSSKIHLEIEGESDIPFIYLFHDGLNKYEALWTAVFWLREYEFPGVWKEMIHIDGKSFRLGGLYRYANFPLTERESDYSKYGESKCTLESS